jgi:hydrogenase 3 maturation protease
MKRMLLGVGNRLSHDDGVGPTVAEALSDSDWIAIDCGTALENATGLVSREQPDLLVVVDAASMGREPGAVFRLSIRATDQMLASTHGLPLAFVLGMIESSAKSVVLIGVEPADLSFGEGLSPAVEAAARTLVVALRHGGPEAIPPYDS